MHNLEEPEVKNYRQKKYKQLLPPKKLHQLQGEENRPYELICSPAPPAKVTKMNSISELKNKVI